MELSVIIVDCGCPYVRCTWKEDSVCWFCKELKEGKRKNSVKARIARGWTYNDETGMIKYNGNLLKRT
jgi:hypothetical protein